MKRIAIIVLAALVLSIAALVTSIIVQVRSSADPASDRTVRLTVERGASFGAVVSRLEDEGVVTHPWALRVYAKVTGSDRHVHRGTYQFTPADSHAEILRRLVSGDVLKVAVTIPEGFTMWEIARAFTVAGVDSTNMLAAIADSALIEGRKIPAATLEGYLFPDTYQVPFGSSASDIVAQMLARSDEVFDDSLVARASEIGMTRHQVLTLASIVEAEARVPDERPTISAVYHNRLRRGMRLEADPTVAYAMGGFRGRLLYVHLETDSPYNTYKNKGLPPGPICSPGEAAIRAALYPAPGVGALYFVARGDGSHVFSMTLQEHLAAIRRIRSGRNGGSDK